MLTACPCCGSRIEARRPVVDLNTNTVAFGQVSVLATPRVAEVLSVLVGKYPGITTLDDLISTVWAGDEFVTLSNIRAHVCFARETVEALGFRIRAISGRGYRLEG
jgi:DNA-binding response OmpR family regulator